MLYQNGLEKYTAFTIKKKIGFYWWHAIYEF